MPQKASSEIFCRCLTFSMQTSTQMSPCQKHWRYLMVNILISIPYWLISSKMLYIYKRVQAPTGSQRPTTSRWEPSPRISPWWPSTRVSSICKMLQINLFWAPSIIQYLICCLLRWQTDFLEFQLTGKCPEAPSPLTLTRSDTTTHGAWNGIQDQNSQAFAAKKG